jgi:hypothetical protein
MIRIYYHIYTSSHKILALSFVDQQMRRIYVSGLPKYAQLNCVIHGPYHKDVEDLVQRYGGWRIIESRPDDVEGLREARTLRYLWSESQLDDAVLFLHTKGINYMSGESRIHGITIPRNLKAINSWRFALEYYNLDEWWQRFNSLKDMNVDTESAFMNLDPYWNYCGNIWWARGSHIRRLPDPTTMQGIDRKNAARAWLFWYKGNHMSVFHVLDKPREDGRGGYGTFRLHEDDLMKYLIEDRDRVTANKQFIMTPAAMDILERQFQELKRQEQIGQE